MITFVHPDASKPLVDLHDWPLVLVMTAAFAHAQASSRCRGFTTCTGGRATCGACEWMISAYASDGDDGSARFGLFALGVIGSCFGGEYG